MPNVLSYPRTCNDVFLINIAHNTNGSGIGAYTAFFAFGGRALFEGSPSLQLVSWVLPALIGVPFSIWLSCKYKPKSSGRNTSSLKPKVMKS